VAIDWKLWGSALALGGVAALLGTEQGKALVADLTRRGKKLTETKLDADGKIPVPPTELARAVSASLGRPVTATALALARMLRSEEGSASVTVKRLLAWVALNDAAELRWTLLKTLTYSTVATRNGLFGKQISRRYSTAQDPYENDLAIAENVIADHAAGSPDPTGGAVKFVNKSAFSSQPGASSYAAVAAKWAKDGLQPTVLPGAPANLVFFRRVRGQLVS